MPSIVVVCGYGCHQNDQLRIYLDRVCRYLNENHVNHLILCGGETQKRTAPGQTEAQAMDTYMRGQGLGVRNTMKMPCSLDRGSYTSIENIQRSAKIINGMYPFDDTEFNGQISDVEVTIFCEASRALKVLWMAKHFMPFYKVRVETMSWEQMHPMKQFFSTLYECTALYVPFLATLFRNQRIRLSESR